MVRLNFKQRKLNNFLIDSNIWENDLFIGEAIHSVYGVNFGKLDHAKQQLFKVRLGSLLTGYRNSRKKNPQSKLFWNIHLVRNHLTYISDERKHEGLNENANKVMKGYQTRIDGNIINALILHEHAGYINWAPIELEQALRSLDILAISMKKKK